VPQIEGDPSLMPDRCLRAIQRVKDEAAANRAAWLTSPNRGDLWRDRVSHEMLLKTLQEFNARKGNVEKMRKREEDQ